ncbi:MAG: serine/threonine-protein kinase [Candidatus Solibacter usitatus]|nr:serine/threonine-protein kinase [Candidatus Solibacter usitatus]
MTIGPGTSLGPYEILSLLGEGGMGTVWKARDPRLGRYVAIKVARAQFTERFDREARAVAALNHNNICTLYDIGPNYLVMEYIEGPTLAARIRQGALSLEDALPILRQIVDAIEEAHDKNIYHRDLKPENIKITPQGVVKVLDFGLAKAADPLPPPGSDPADAATVRLASVVGMIMGTPEYMAPEQASGKPVDKRVDIWSFAVVLWETLVGRRMFQGETIAHTISEVLTKDLMVSEAPPEVRPLLRRCLVRDPNLRMRDIGEARLTLMKIAAGERETPPAPPAVETRRRWPYIAAAFFLLTTIGVGGYAWFLTRPVPKPLIKLETDLGAPLPSLNSTLMSFAVSPDASRIVFVGRNKGGTVLFSRRLDQDSATPMPGTEGAAYPFFSPDSRMIGFFAGDALKKVSVDGGAAITLCPSPSGRGASWGEDGNIIAALSRNAELSMVPASGGKPTAVTDLRPDGSHRFPFLLPGGRGVLFVAGKTPNDFTEANVEVHSFKDRKRRTLASGFYPRYLPSGHLTYIHANTLFAVTFDLDRMELKGTAFPLLENVAVHSGRGHALYDLSRGGMLVHYRGTGGDQRGLEWLDSLGHSTPIPGMENVFRQRLSPDGSRLGYIEVTGNGRNIGILDLKRNAKVKLTFEGGVSEFAWTPDSRAILFSTTTKLYWTRADGASKPQQILAGNDDLYLHDISPDGKLLAVGKARGSGEVFLAKLEYNGAPSGDSAPRVGTFVKCCEDPGQSVFASRFSPDGKWIAYQSGEFSSGFQVYVRAVPDTGAKWQVSAGEGGFTPVWSPKGHEVYYRGRAGRIMVVDYSTKSGAFVPGTPRFWTERIIEFGNQTASGMTVAPDGKRMIVPVSMGLQDGVPPPATIIFNLFDEVRRRAQANGQ